MKLIESYAVDLVKWDAMVKRLGDSYQFSWWVANTAKNWCVIVDEQYSKGIILAYNQVMGKKILYPPVYGRVQLFMGMDHTEQVGVFDIIRKHFVIGTLQVNTTPFPGTRIERLYQVLEKAQLNKLAGRMLKKAQAAQLTLQAVNWKDSFHLIETELAPRVASIQGENLNRLKNLLQTIEDHGMLISTGIFSGERLLGCMYYVRDGERLLYLKGAASPEIRDQGGMYLAMHEAVNLATQQQLKMDFGGSSIEGIRRFFMAFGGEDVRYYQYTWNAAPMWFNVLRKIAKMLR